MAKFIDNNGFAHFLGKLKTLLDGKANSTHTHAASDITSGNIVTGVKGNSENSYRTGEVNLTAANIGAAASSHTHGNIQNGGTLQTTDVDIANGDKLVVTDSSNSNKVARTSVAFDGSTETKCLSKKGTWVDVNNYSLPTASDTTKGGVKIGAGLTMTEEVLSASEMTGATSSAAGSAGMVPAPAAGDQLKVLTGAGEWKTPTLVAASPASGVKMIYLKLGSDVASSVSMLDALASTSYPGFMSSTDKSKLDAFSAASDYALKSDITSMYKHKGSVSAVGNLPSSGQTAGDVYNVTSTGMNYVWTGTEWDALGEVFTIDSMTTTEIDAAFVTAGLAAA